MVEQQTMMVSFRRMVMRKRRCIIILLGVVFIFTLISTWLHILSDSPTSPVEELTLHPLEPKEPKFNVLEPPNIINEINPKKDTGGNSKSVTQKVLNTEIDQSQKMDSLVVISATRIFQNQTENIEVVKNKTLSQLGLMGGENSAKIIPNIIFVKQRWNLTISFEDIGSIMKDTSFLNKLKPLDLSGPTLTSTRNRTANFSLSMPLKMGYCDCWERYCYCCVQLVNKQLHLSNKTCANFTFISKSHELDISFSIDNKTVYKGIISADAPPLLCVGSFPAVADMCVHFFNMAYRVDRLGLHKSQILGCADMSLNIYNKTISIFPVDCFQIPGDPNHHPKQEHIILPNFVP